LTVRRKPNIEKYDIWDFLVVEPPPENDDDDSKTE
jgi:hypothetical protein